MSRRTDRISQLLQEKIASLLFKLKHPPSTIVTITEVVVSPDIKNARVFYSVMDESEQKTTQKILEESRKFFSKELSKVLKTKNFPKLTFEYDATPKRAARVFEIFEKLEREKKSSNDG